MRGRGHGGRPYVAANNEAHREAGHEKRLKVRAVFLWLKMGGSGRGSKRQDPGYVYGGVYLSVSLRDLDWWVGKTPARPR